VFDIADEGFALTSARDGIDFDFFGSGTRRRISWTAGGSHNAWLVFDMNRNGQIDSGIEMFGNSMPQPGKRAGRIGFTALAQFDSSQQGGNGDGIIDNRDAISRYLLLWTDSNHNGVSEANELQTLAQAGVDSVSLNYSTSKQTDAFGNELRYRSHFHTNRNGYGKNHWVYDVILLPKPAKH